MTKGANYKKGANNERDLLEILWNMGYAVIRAAGSGKARLPTPDIVAIKDDRRFVIECKSRVTKYLYISREQIDELKLWATRSNSTPIIALKKRKWFIFNIEDLEQKKESFGLNLEDFDQERHSIEKFFG